ncbi:MAG TPA: flippase-like domain-containing protein, partial [Spirochaetia bacterium]|nr:flippase-like domain-containing protein [Spirochaetia bacterium]
GFFHEHIMHVTVLNVLFLASGIFQILFVGLAIAGLLRPRLVIRLFSAMGKLFYRMKLIKNKGRFRRQLVYEANLARNSFKRYFGRHIIPFILGTLTIGIMYFVEVITLWIIFIGLGVRLPFATGITLGALFLFLLPFLPTPGAAGLGEAFFVVLFAGLVPYYLLGVAVLLWRFFYNYLTAFAGALFSSRHFSKVIVKSET